MYSQELNVLQSIRKNIAFEYYKLEENSVHPVLTTEQMLAHKTLVEKLKAVKRKTTAYEREEVLFHMIRCFYYTL